MKWERTLKDYKDYLRIERGLSSNTISNYALDIEKLIGFLSEHKLRESPLQITQETVQAFIYDVAKNMNPRSQARIISGLKGFFNYLIFCDT